MRNSFMIKSECLQYGDNRQRKTYKKANKRTEL